MNVVYKNGKHGVLSEKESKNLYVKGRHTTQEWKALEIQMDMLGISKFDDPFLSTLGGSMVTIEYVKNQIEEHIKYTSHN